MDSRGERQTASAIRFEDVTKFYPGATRPAVDHVSISIEPGELVVLLGPSGCGKTTLLKLTNRLLAPTAGSVVIDGQDISESPPHLLRRRIGYVIQQAGLFPHMRVEDNVAVVPKLLGWDQRRISDRIDELLNLVGLPPGQYRRRYPGQLSGGEQQRVGLARAMAGGPSTLLMDEPFGALDAITRSRLQEELRSIHSRLGQTVLFVTHDVEEAMRLADRVAVMDQGRVVQFDKPSCVVLAPASDFVARLMGSGDVMRRLSLTPVSAAAQPVRDGIPPGIPTIAATDNLRTALGLLLESRSSSLAVEDGRRQITGIVDLDSIHSTAASQWHPGGQLGESRG